MQSLNSTAVAASTAVDQNVGSPIDRVGSSEAGTARRIDALDFTKGILVIIMVLYHWMNYFVTGHDWIYKYLRFLPISFTFISGFLISQVYLSKYKGTDQRIPKRLLTRGVKLLAIAASLNLAPRIIHFGVFRAKADEWSLTQFAWDYFTGMRPISFSVLVPIAYLLMSSAGLFYIAKYWRPAYNIWCLVLFVCSVVCEAKGINSGYLQTVSMGMLGVSVGHISLDKINRLLEHPFMIFFTYAAYLVGISLLTDSYLLQVFGVCVTLLVIYYCGTRDIEERAAGPITILLGQYSLFSYIIQIVILQILRGSFRALAASAGISLLALAICIGGTILSVAALKRARRTPAVNTLYKAVFA
jgi:peptidoglycan/LPS O-acetylase OafA/YrhL